MKIIRFLIVLMVTFPLFVLAKNKDESLVHKMSAVPGETIEQTLPTEKQFKSFSLDMSPEAGSWVSVSRSPEISKSKHKGTGVDITIQVPENALFGIYKGIVYFDGKPSSPGKSLAIELEVTEPVIFLPPEPGSASDTTIAGIDSDSDGVRDDVQRYIYFAYLNQPAVQLALMDVARSLQAALVSAESREDAYQAVKSFDAAYNCLSWIERDATYELVSRLLAQQMNTRDRTRAYDEFQKAAVGNVIMNNKSSENYYQECSFDISQY